VRVVIDTSYALRAPYSGTGIYIQRLCAELATTPGLELIPVANERRRAPAGGGLGSARNLASDWHWEARALPRIAARERADVIHHPLPALSPLTRIPRVVTIVDLAFERLPDCFDRGYRTYAHVAHRAAARSAQAVVCISETTAVDARELWGVDADRIVVAHLGPGQELEPASSSAPAPEHFLYVGDDEPRKNLQALLAAYRNYRRFSPEPLGLVLAGSARASGPGVRIEDRPDARRLAELYAGAAALVHPSLYEGFGLTPLEAMRLGVPVIAARSPGVIEVCADAAVYANPADASAFAAAMREIAEDGAVRERLRERGRSRAREFSWRRCAEAHRGAYSLALAQ